MLIELKDIQGKDRKHFMEMYKDFYNSPAVLRDVTDEHVNTVFENAIKDKTFTRTLLVYCNGEIAGYLLIAFTYSSEAAGKQLSLEELYIKPEFQGKGIGSKVFDWIFKEYKNIIKRYRLEVIKSNKAKNMYERIGFETLDYLQMIYDVK